LNRPISHALTALIVVLLLPACGIAEQGDDVDAVARGNAAFALDLYRELRTESGNLFVSPLSVSAALATTWLGARGETDTQMADVLHLPEVGALEEGGEHREPMQRERVARAFGALRGTLAADGSADGHLLAEANALWGQEGYPFLEQFLALARDGFGSEVTRLDFASDTEGARRSINSWTERATNGKIEDLLRPGDLDPGVRIVLTNAVYFKGRWARQFDESATRDATFHREPGRPERDVTVPMMFQTAEFPYARLEEERALALELPYAGGRVSMLVILPDEDAPGGLAGLEERLSPARLDAWTSIMNETRVTVGLPSFSVTWGTTDLVPSLRNLGMVAPFGGSADFSGIDGTKEIYIAKVMHKAFVDVNEEGTEAAAATAVVGRLKASPPPVFRADRPFLFLIRDAGTGSVLFIGRIADPTA
jgi:serpin B